jgi:hypothetical protein
MRSGRFSWLLLDSGVFWCVLVRSFWNVLVCSGAFFVVLVSSGEFWWVVVDSNAF